ncbi:MAG: hypothetical protein AB2L14_29880 [Candidatus Xenobiia bacterium LiM19]
MDLGILVEVLVEKGYIHILSGCVVALIVLLILRKVIPETKAVCVECASQASRVFFEEPFGISVKVKARRKVIIEELSVFVECLTVVPEKGVPKKKTFFFTKNVLLKDVTLYRNREIEEKTTIKVPEQDKDKFLPGTFTSYKGDYGIVWEFGYIVKIFDSFNKIEEKKSIVVYPVNGGL